MPFKIIFLAWSANIIIWGPSGTLFVLEDLEPSSLNIFV